MTAPLVVVGAGGFGREVLELVHDVNAAASSPAWEVVGVLDDGEVDEALLAELGTRHLGGVDAAEQLHRDVSYVIGIGGCSARAAIDARLSSLGFRAATLVHPTAVVGRRSVQVGEGSVLCAYSSATTHVVLGRHVHLNPHASVGHDSRLGDHTTVTPQAGIAGNVDVGARVFIGTGALVGPGLRVGDDALIGMGAVVVRDVTSGTTVAGVPARVR